MGQVSRSRRDIDCVLGRLTTMKYRSNATIAASLCACLAGDRSRPQRRATALLIRQASGTMRTGRETAA